jgi:two-component system sensor histidine kinase FlrB
MSESPANSAEVKRLAEAFQVFNQVSADLSSAYTQLQLQVVALTERMALLQDTLPAGVVIIDAEGRIVQANPAAERLFGAGLTGQSWALIERQYLVASDLPGEYLTGGDYGKRLALTVSALDSAGGRIMLLHDISEAYRLKTQAERNDRLAAMGEMAAQLAHQLRTPLAAALLYAGNLENPDLPAANRVAIAEKTVARLRHLERLIRDMLMFARGEALGREEINSGELMNEISHTIEPLARARGVVFTVVDAADQVNFIGNRKELTGALANLLDNALHAVSSGGLVEFEIRALAERMEFVVRDNGVGMSAQLVAKVFEPFFTTRESGTGLGLAIARGVARAHGGNVEVSSMPDCGTEFVFSIARSAGGMTEAA